MSVTFSELISKIQKLEDLYFKIKKECVDNRTDIPDGPLAFQDGFQPERKFTFSETMIVTDYLLQLLGNNISKTELKSQNRYLQYIQSDTGMENINQMMEELIEYFISIQGMCSSKEHVSPVTRFRKLQKQIINIRAMLEQIEDEISLEGIPMHGILFYPEEKVKKLSAEDTLTSIRAFLKVINNDQEELTEEESEFEDYINDNNRIEDLDDIIDRISNYLSKIITDHNRKLYRGSVSEIPLLPSSRILPEGGYEFQEAQNRFQNRRY